MKFGKRRKDADPPAGEPAFDATSDAPPLGVTHSWTVPREEPPAHEGPAAVEPTPYGVPEAVVEGEAVEILADVPAQATPSAIAYEPAAAFVPPAPVPQPAALPFPVADEPIAVVASGPSEHEATIPLGAAAETFASGHGQDHGPVPAPAWPDGIQDLVAERPEVVVGAAFAGGILAAMILRRLGN